MQRYTFFPKAQNTHVYFRNSYFYTIADALLQLLQRVLYRMLTANRLGRKVHHLPLMEKIGTYGSNRCKLSISSLLCQDTSSKGRPLLRCNSCNCKNSSFVIMQKTVVVMGTIADAKFTHNYNFYNGYFIGCLRFTYLARIEF